MGKRGVIFQINTTANVGSVGKDAEGISRAAIERGYESWISYGVLHNFSCANLYQIETPIEQYINALRTRLFDNEGLSAIDPTNRLIAKMKEVKPDLVVLHNLHGYYLNYKLLFKYLKEANIFVIYSLHDCWAFTGHCTYFVSENCNRWQKECYGCPLKKDYPTSWFIDRSRRNFIIKKEMTCALNKMIVVTVSDWLKGLVEKSFLKKFPVYRIYNGVRTETFTYRLGRKDMWPGKKVLIGCALRWDDSNGKGLYDYLKLAKILSPEYIIVLVGHFDNPKTLASLPKNIINVDRTENQVKLAEYYSRADVLMNLSYQETMGLTSVEGMACGIPCVVYNTTASPELITPETGITVEPGNIKEVWNAVKELVAKGKVKYRDACRNRALDQFDEVKQFSKYLDLYEKIIGQEMTI